jgi:hypothetical protein
VILAEHWNRCRARSEALGVALGLKAFVFSPDPDGRRHLKPSSVTQRFARLADRLGIDAHLHSLRHYAATELIAAGVDVRTVAGRLGHSGGGITTLRVYAAWMAEADQRAAAGLLARMPARPDSAVSPAERAKSDPQSPRERLAVQLRDRILAGEFAVGSHLPGVKQLAATHGIAPSTAHRAIALLKEWGMVAGELGQRVTVVATSEHENAGVDPLPVVAVEAIGVGSGERLLDLEIRHRGELFRRLSAEADPRSAEDLYELLAGALRRAGRKEAEIADYEMDVRADEELLTTFVAARPRSRSGVAPG